MIKKIVKGLAVTAYRCLTHLIPTKKGLVVFDSFMGKSYSGSVRAIYERMEKHRGSFSFEPVWVFTREALRKGLAASPDCRIVTYGTFSYYILMSRASVWVFDTRHEGYLVKKRSQRYVQTWHGTPLKKLGADIDTFSMKAENADDEKYREKALLKYKDKVAQESAKWDVLLSASPFTTKVFRSCFSYKGEILECGYPRNDVLFQINNAGASAAGDTVEPEDTKDREPEDTKDREPADTKDREPGKKKNILYAPTWRDDVYSGEGWWYGYEPSLDIEALEKALGGEWTLTVKLHYLVKSDADAFPKSAIESGFLRIARSSEDMAGLLKEADVLITDYSSVMFDYALLERPMFFYAYDLERYRDKLRGWYFDFEQEAPGPISRDTDSLIKDIVSLGTDRELTEKWQDKRKAFRDKFASFEDGHASECVAKKIENFITG
ncbi:MAG: CDP-glycerol glycerophosphotransferase family protein [Lachnospiraceae bacterium]|nr:CDP-glycerol glycerophosphotransferase family protein [Lachnospiraceae bacterium]